jgi:pyruvate dehydrogenase E1 component
MITEAAQVTSRSSVTERIAYRAFSQAIAMVHAANSRKDKQPGDPKIGGHPASIASCVHILAALHLEVRRPEDWVGNKPHCSPMDHALHHLLGLLRHSKAVNFLTGEDRSGWFTEEEAKSAMHGLRAFPRPEMPHVFQSYHAAADPDNYHFLPSGTVGIPPVVGAYMGLAHRYAGDHGWEVPTEAHFWSLIGDSEFREGSLLEAMPEIAERELGNVTWIIDYNRQSLDGTRLNNEQGLERHDCDRIAATGEANGWRVRHVRHGKMRREAFEREGGAELREVLESGLTDYEFQMLALRRHPGAVRRMVGERSRPAGALLDDLSDEQVLQVLLDLGGHCYETVREALEWSREESDEPTLLIVHTIKGWGLECLADPANHSTLPKKGEVDALVERAGGDPANPFAWFSPDSAEGRFLAQRRDAFRDGMDEQRALVERNTARFRAALEEGGELPNTLGIDLSLFPRASTQWMLGQCAAKVVRVGSADATAERDGKPAGELTSDERALAPVAEFMMTLSPDVGSSTNISPAMDQRIYGPEVYTNQLEKELEVKYKHPELVATEKRWTRHLRFEIAEANAMSAMGAFGKMREALGLPFLPIMTVYDFFVKRALDQLYYDVYWGSEFIMVGTPAGVTLSPEGAQHSWKSDIQMPNMVTWEPCFAVELDWIMADTMRRHASGDNAGRQGTYLRCVTRGVEQALLLKWLRRQARSKQDLPGTALKPAGADGTWGDAVDEATIACLPDEVLLERTRQHTLAGGYRLVDWRGYAGYEPGDNVVELLAMGSLVMEAVQAAEELLERGVFANVTVVTSQDLLLGIQAEQDGYRHLTSGLGFSGDLHAVAGAGDTEAGMVSLAARRVPIVAVCDGEAGILDNAGSVVGVKQVTLAVRKFSKCGRPVDVFQYQHLDPASIAEACGQALSLTALEDLRISPNLLERLAGRTPAGGRDWRALWPDAPGS